MRTSPSPPFDLAIVGAGIAGASLAFAAVRAAPGLRVLLLEREAQPGYHSTGRSAAMFAAGYGPPPVRALTRASQGFFTAPPPGLAAVPLLHRRGELVVAAAADAARVDALHAALVAEGLAARRLDSAGAQALCPVLRPEAAAAAVLEPDAADIDVDALHQGCLRAARAAGAVLACHAGVTRIERDAGRWRLDTTAGGFEALRVANAAGAWADELGALAGLAPLGLEPRRRSAFVFEPPPGLDAAAWPLVIDAGESWYLKPDAGLLLGSPANADPVPPHDVLPEELDIATGIHHIQQATTLTIRRPRRTWAGLRSFVPDGVPAIGAEPAEPSFTWVAGQGGYGIQSAPAAGALAAAMALGLTPPDWADAALIASLSPERLR